MSWTLKEAVHFDRQQVTTQSWVDYPTLRFSEVPALTIHVLDQPDQPSLGAGESVQGPLDRLAGAQGGLVGLVEDVDGQGGYFGKTQGGVVHPALRGDLLAIEVNRFFQGPAHALQRSTLGLVDHTIEVHHPAGWWTSMV